MWLSVRKYVQIIKALSTLLSRPYLSEIVENPDGTITFSFVQGNKTYRFTALQEKRMLQ